MFPYKIIKKRIIYWSNIQDGCHLRGNLRYFVGQYGKHVFKNYQFIILWNHWITLYVHWMVLYQFFCMSIGNKRWPSLQNKVFAQCSLKENETVTFLWSLIELSCKWIFIGSIQSFLFFVFIDNSRWPPTQENVLA